MRLFVIIKIDSWWRIACVQDDFCHCVACMQPPPPGSGRGRQNPSCMHAPCRTCWKHAGAPCGVVACMRHSVRTSKKAASGKRSTLFRGIAASSGSSIGGKERERSIPLPPRCLGASRIAPEGHSGGDGDAACTLPPPRRPPAFLPLPLCLARSLAVGGHRLPGADAGDCCVITSYPPPLTDGSLVCFTPNPCCTPS
jgi:hypothetical protein